MPDRGTPDLARLYQLNARASRFVAPLPPDAADAPPSRRRVYVGAPRIDLPGRDYMLAMPLGHALARRRSRRDFVSKPMALDPLGRLLFSSFGVRSDREALGADVPGTTGYRASPSAGGLYPLELYVAVQAIDGLDDGVYHYDPWSHQLAQRRAGNVHPQLAAAMFGQSFLAAANVVVCLTAIAARTMHKYGQRGYRYVLFEAGHVAQNVYLAADAMGLLPLAVGGFFDRDVDRLLRLPAEEEESLYLIAVGQPAY